MIQVKGIRDLREILKAARTTATRIGLVPTMGCLHAGHLSLIAAARRRSDFVVVSIFVNPMQFGPGEDYDRYPRTPAEDISVCRNAGVDLLFNPEPTGLYASDHSASVEETVLSRGLCGKHRPGHFRGVTTIVAKLFNLVAPDIAVFGQKDAQQLAVVRRMVRDLNFPVRIIGAPTVREHDGLALSSRNKLLDPESRRNAPLIHQSLKEAAGKYRRGQRDPKLLCREIISRIEEQSSLRVEYAAAVDNDTLDPVCRLRANVRLMLAVRAGAVRLIDNELLA